MTLYEGTSSALADERLASCDCANGRGGLQCRHTEVLLEQTTFFKQEIVLSRERENLYLWDFMENTLSAGLS